MTTLEQIVRPNQSVDVTPPSAYFGAQVPALTPTVVVAYGGVTVAWHYSVEGDPSSLWVVGDIISNGSAKTGGFSSSGNQSYYMAARQKEKYTPNLLEQLQEAVTAAANYPPGS